MAGTKNKARSPVQKRGIETRDRIIEAGMSLFTEAGYYNTNALEIAARAGVATGTFYSYFNNKKEVLVEVMNRFYRDVTDHVLNTYQIKVRSTREENYTEGRKMVRFMIRALHSAHALNPRLHRELLAMILLDGEIEKINAAEEKKVLDRMTGLMEEYREHIRVDDPETAAFLLYRTGEEIIHRIRILGTGLDNERLLDELEEMMCRYLLVSP